MDAPKFTPGPLEAVGFYVRTSLKDGGVLLADLSNNGMHGNRAADAALYAAAPELYASLDYLFSFINAYHVHPHDGQLQEQVAKAKTALAKARGEA